MTLPRRADADALLAFLPALETPGRDWLAASQPPWGVQYAPDVVRFFGAIGECWLDRAYNPAEAAQILADDERLAQADLAAVRQMLTHLVRCERFSEGAREALLRAERVQALLHRLAALRDTLHP